VNLLAETIDAIQRSGHNVSDVAFVGSANAEYRCTWDQFTQLADKEYHDGFGASEVATDLIVRFSDGRKMWRGEYDGSEWWDFDPIANTDYTKPGKPIHKLIGGLWESVAGLNGDDL
jgi:hypothetical protein